MEHRRRQESISLIKKNIGSIIGVCIMILLLGYTIYQDRKTRRIFNDPNIEKRIGIATIIDYQAGAKGPPSFKYQYIINGGTYEQRHPIISKLRQKSDDELRQYIGNRYFVLFVVKDPLYSRLLLNEPVLDSELEAPDNGWTLE